MMEGEFAIYGEATVLQDAKNLVQELSMLAQQSHSSSLLVKAMILQARFAVIEDDLMTAINLLEQAKLTAKANGLVLLAETASAERQFLENQHEEWLTLVRTDASFQEWLERAHLKDYLMDALRLVHWSREQ